MNSPRLWSRPRGPPAERRRVAHSGEMGRAYAHAAYEPAQHGLGYASAARIGGRAANRSIAAARAPPLPPLPPLPHLRRRRRHRKRRTVSPSTPRARARSRLSPRRGAATRRSGPSGASSWCRRRTRTRARHFGSTRRRASEPGSNRRRVLVPAAAAVEAVEAAEMAEVAEPGAEAGAAVGCSGRQWSVGSAINSWGSH